MNGPSLMVRRYLIGERQSLASTCCLLERYATLAHGPPVIGALLDIIALLFVISQVLYALHEIGPFAGITLGRRSELQISTGASQQTGRGTSGYLRASIYRSL